MDKWYNESNVDDDVIISSRVRLARNLVKYPYYIKINEEDSKLLKDDIYNAVFKDENTISKDFDFIDMSEKSNVEKLVLVEKHSISQSFLQERANTALLLKKDEKVSIMINEEDHIRLQCILQGNNIDKALDIANEMDDLIEDTVDYAFDKDFGYLTSCPTNLGTGLRASYMVHMPMLGISGQLQNIINAISKLGMTIRGVYGEGTEPIGDIYQISNQTTLGKSESEIISNLKNITNQIIEKENKLRNGVLETSFKEWEDKAYRSYGILKYSKTINIREATSLLSNVRLGYLMGVLKEKPPTINIYNIMMNIRSGNIQQRYNKELAEQERDILRAEYLNSIFNDINFNDK